MKKGHIILTALLLVACSNVDVTHDVLPDPSATPEEARLEHVQISFHISDSETLNPLPGAKIWVKTPLDNPLETQSDSNGLASQSGVRHQVPVQIQVSAEGYLPVLKQFHLQPVSQQESLSVDIPMQKARSQISGKVLDPNGLPLPQVVIFDGTQSVLSQSDGRFELSYAQNTSLFLSAYKRGYAPAKAPVETAKVTDLTMTLTPLSPKPLGIYEGHGHLGMSRDAFRKSFEPVSQWLTQEGFEWQYLDTLALETIDTLWMLSPDQPFSESDQQKIRDYVEGGGKLMIFGEWAGFQGVHLPGLNQLLSPMGLRFESDTLRSVQNTDIDVAFEASPLVDGITKVTFVNPGSLTCTHIAQCQILGRSSYQSFQIKNQSSYGVLAHGLYGLGQVWVTGDSSFVLQATNGQGEPLKQGNHQDLLKALINS